MDNNIKLNSYNIKLKKLCSEDLNIDFRFNVYDLMANAYDLTLDNNKVLTTRRLLYLTELVSVPCIKHDKRIRQFILYNYYKTKNEENYQDLIDGVCPWC